MSCWPISTSTMLDFFFFSLISSMTPSSYNFSSKRCLEIIEVWLANMNSSMPSYHGMNCSIYICGGWKMFSSKKLITLDDSLETINGSDFSIILDRHWFGKSVSMLTIVSKDWGHWLSTAKNSAVFPLLSGFKIWSGRVLSVPPSVSFCFSYVYLTLICSISSELSAK